MSLLIVRKRIPLVAANTARMVAAMTPHRYLTTHFPNSVSNLFTGASFRAPLTKPGALHYRGLFLVVCSCSTPPF